MPLKRNMDMETKALAMTVDATVVKAAADTTVHVQLAVATTAVAEKEAAPTAKAAQQHLPMHQQTLHPPQAKAKCKACCVDNLNLRKGEPDMGLAFFCLVED